VRAAIATVHREVYRTDDDASVNVVLFITTSVDDPTTTTKRIEQNNHIVRSGKYEAEFTNNRRLSSTYYTIEANY